MGILSNSQYIDHKDIFKISLLGFVSVYTYHGITTHGITHEALTVIHNTVKKSDFGLYPTFGVVTVALVPTYIYINIIFTNWHRAYNHKLE